MASNPQSRYTRKAESAVRAGSSSGNLSKTARECRNMVSITSLSASPDLNKADTSSSSSWRRLAGARLMQFEIRPSADFSSEDRRRSSTLLDLFLMVTAKSYATVIQYTMLRRACLGGSGEL